MSPSAAENAGGGGQRSAAQESVRDLAKLLISLASAVVALSVTFTDKLSQGVGYVVIVLLLAWACLAASIICGVNAMSKLAHAQWTGAEKWGDWTFPQMRWSWRSFKAGILLLLIFAATSAAIKARQPVRDMKVPVTASVSCAGPPMDCRTLLN